MADTSSRTYSAEAVRIDGLAELRTDLRKISRQLPKIMRDANVTAARLVRDEAAPNLVTKHGHKAPSRLTAGGTQKYGYVQLRGATAFGDEYGAVRYRQFRPFKGRTGYALWPAVRKQRPILEARILDWIEQSFERRAA